METIIINSIADTATESENLESIIGLAASEENKNNFIQANTIFSSVDEIKNNHIIPVFTKDNEPVINHTDFVEAAYLAVDAVFGKDQTSSTDLSIKVSHPVKGRIPEAKLKPANLLQENEKTLYYERMAFMLEIPTIRETINNQDLCLTVGGVKAYNLDNINTKRSEQQFKIFIGFKNFVCTNLCISTDGYKGTVKVMDTQALYLAMVELFQKYNAQLHLNNLRNLLLYSLTEHQFAQVIGKARLYQYLPTEFKRKVPAFKLLDSQVNAIADHYYHDKHFRKNENGSINLWNMYNLLTGANKSSYIDSFIDRSVNCFDFTNSIASALEHHSDNWFLN